jgi:hypothetical protein
MRASKPAAMGAALVPGGSGLRRHPIAMLGSMLPLINPSCNFFECNIYDRSLFQTILFCIFRKKLCARRFPRSLLGVAGGPLPPPDSPATTPNPPARPVCIYRTSRSPRLKLVSGGAAPPRRGDAPRPRPARRAPTAELAHRWPSPRRASPRPPGQADRTRTATPSFRAARQGGSSSPPRPTRGRPGAE